MLDLYSKEERKQVLMLATQRMRAHQLHGSNARNRSGLRLHEGQYVSEFVLALDTVVPRPVVISVQVPAWKVRLFKRSK